jgi:hypothetical protein
MFRCLMAVERSSDVTALVGKLQAALGHESTRALWGAICVALDAGQSSSGRSARQLVVRSGMGRTEYDGVTRAMLRPVRAGGETGCP